MPCAYHSGRALLLGGVEGLGENRIRQLESHLEAYLHLPQRREIASCYAKVVTHRRLVGRPVAVEDALMPRAGLLVILVLFFLFGMGGDPLGDVSSIANALSLEVGGEIVEDTTWTDDDGPIVVTSGVIVPEGIVLRVAAGTNVFFRNNAGISVKGTLHLRGRAVEPIRMCPETDGLWWGGLRISGLQGTLDIEHTYLQGGSLEIIEGAGGVIEDSTFSVSQATSCISAHRAGHLVVRRSRFDSVSQPIRCSRTRVLVEDCTFRNMADDGIVAEYPSAEILPPESLRLTVPERVVAGKLTILRVDVLDKRGDLYWWMWDGIGTVSAVRTDTHEAVPLSTTGFAITNGIGSLTVSIDFVGEIELAVSVDGLSVSRIVTCIDDTTSRTTVPHVLIEGFLDWGPEHGVIHLATRTVVTEGDLLTIRPGTLVMLDDMAGLTVRGKIRAEGTQEAPILFFPTDSHAHWDQIRHENAEEEMVYESVFLVGGAGGPREIYEEHTLAGAAVRFVTGSARIENSVFVDHDGKGLFTESGSEYFLSNCLFSRNQLGAEFHGDTVWVDDCYFLDMKQGDDYDCLYLWRPTLDHRVRRCIVARGGDDGIDTLGSAAKISDCIVRGVSDKNITLYRGNSEVSNCLILDARRGIGIDGDRTRVTNCTVVGHSLDGFYSKDAWANLEKVILWDNTYSIRSNTETLDVVLNYCDLNPPPTPFPGTGNLNSDPLFLNPVNLDYRLQPGSPAMHAGPAGEQIGWLGYPSAGASPPSPPSIIRRCVFESGGGNGVLFSNGADCLVEGCRFVEIEGAALSFATTSACEVVRCVVDLCGAGVSLRSGGAAFLDHLTIVGCTDAGLLLDDAVGDLQNSILWNSEPPVVSDARSILSVGFSNVEIEGGAVYPGAGNINEDPRFVDELGGDYRLLPGSPSIHSGRDGLDMGAFYRPAFSGGSGWLLR